MPQLTYEKEITGLIVIDPYNDFSGGWGPERVAQVPPRLAFVSSLGS
jgi:hypothetical protein